MRRLAVGVTITLIIVLVLVVYVYTAIINLTEEVIEPFKQLEKYVKDENWELAQESIDLLNQRWYNAKKTLTLISDDTDVDKVDKMITRISSLVEMKIKDKALVELAVAKRSLKQISERERVSIRNIF